MSALEHWFTGIGTLEARGWQPWDTTAGFIIYLLLVRRYWLWARERAATGNLPNAFDRAATAVIWFALAGMADDRIQTPVRRPV